MPRFSRRGVLSASLAGIVGVIVGGVGGYSLRQPEVREAVRTLTQTVTRAVTETRLQTDVRTVTQTATITVGGRSPPPKDKITLASTTEAVGLGMVKQQHTTRIFNAMGYNAELSNLGVRGAIAAFMANQAQILIGVTENVATPIDQEQDIIIVGGTTSHAYYIVATADINSLKDFEGKTFGIARIGSISHTIPAYMMQQAGVDIDKVQWVAIGGTGERAMALLAGRIAGGLLHADVALRTVKESHGKLKLLGTVSDVVPGRVLDQQLIAVYRDWAEKNPHVVMDFLRAQILSDAWAAVNSEEFIKMVAEGVFGKVDQEGLEFYTAVYDLYRSKGYLPFFIDTKSLPISLKIAKDVGTITKDIDWRKVYEPKYLNAVIKGLSEYIPKAV
jgi:ABC-type nitrate/sulfonate/bicarbonate transport system substrate-binding protein